MLKTWHFKQTLFAGSAFLIFRGLAKQLSAVARTLRGALWPLLACGLLGTMLTPVAQASSHGVAIANTAQISYTIAGFPQTRFSNTVTTTPTVVRTAATITVLRYWPPNPAANPTNVPLSSYQTAGGGTVAVGDVYLPGAASPLNLGSPVPLAAASVILGGEPIFVQVRDPDQNLDPGLAETLVVVLRADGTGDMEILVLTETGPDTGIFIGVMQTSTALASAQNGVLSVQGNKGITVTYTDPADGSDSIAAAVLVDPLGIVFDSRSGLPVDGAQVTLINADSGLPANVLGLDGVSSYPGTVITGSTVTDDGGTVYNLPPGGFQFPSVLPGNYRLEVTPPVEYSFPSTVTDADLQLLPGAPYALGTGSRGEVFVVAPGPAVNIDVPIDPSGTGLFVAKVARKSVAGIGDFVPYDITLENSGGGAAVNIQVTDTLPPGFRFESGSARVGGQRVADPVVGGKGRQLLFTVPSLAAGGNVVISYVAQITPGTKPGAAYNTAVATDSFAATSNIARAKVDVRDDFFRDKTFITGRVVDGDCDALESREAPGLENARIYLEDGSYVLTDESGRYHFEGLTPGTHVVQIDFDSLPQDYEVLHCDVDTRSAGRSFSRFVDIQGGSLWRVDFVVKRRPPRQFKVMQQLSVSRTPTGADIRLIISGDDIAVTALRPILMLPPGLTYVPDSAMVDGEPVAAPQAFGETLTFNLGNVQGEGAWRRDFQLQVQGAFATHNEVIDTSIKSMVALVAQGKTERLPPAVAQGDPASRARMEANYASGESQLQITEQFDEPVIAAKAGALNLQKNLQKDAAEENIVPREPGIHWLFPTPDFVPAIGALKLFIQHLPGQSVNLLLNGEPVNRLNFYGTTVSPDKTVALSKWQGVDIKIGDNRFVAEVRDANGTAVERLERTVHFSDVPVKAKLLVDKSNLVADGKTPPVVAVQFFDRHGYPARPGVIGDYSINAPYESRERFKRQQRQSLAVVENERPRFEIGAGGIGYIELQPTTDAGELVLQFDFENDYREEVRAWLSAGQREWIMVGLAERTIGQHVTSGDKDGLGNAGIDDGGFSDGRVAFFAKGTIRGDWLLTAAYDTDKRTGDSLKQTIDPDSYYTLYGDNSYQQYEAPSQRKLYLKLEKKQFYAMFGDFDTGLSVTELGRYSRTVNGAKMEFRGDLVEANLFVTESEQGFVRKEIPGDGTSGKYFLGSTEVIINSEKIVIETRDRLHSERIISSEVLSRHIDYNIDYDDGSLFFKRPIPARDDQFNPVYIVVEYETAGGTGSGYTGGGRVAIKPTEDIEVGVTAIHEEGGARSGDLVANDITLQISDSTELRIEAARTEQDDEQSGESTSGDAYLVELETRGGQVENLLYARQQDAEFGLGQQRAAEGGTRKVGNMITYHLNDNYELRADTFRQQHLESDATREVADALLEYDNLDQARAYGGMRMARDKFDDGDIRKSNQLLLGGAYGSYDNRITLHTDAELGVGSSGSDDDSADFPNRIVVGADYKLTESLDLFVANEWTWGDDRDTESTRAGLRVRPWAGADISTSLEQQATPDGARLFANLGALQNWRIDDRWTMDFSLDRSQAATGPEAGPGTGLREFNPQVDPASGGREDYTAIATSLGYRLDGREWLSRLEWRDSDTEQKWNASMGWLQELDEGFTFASGINLNQTDTVDVGRGVQADARLHLAYRPTGGRWTVLERMDFIHEDIPGVENDGFVSRRMVSNLLANYRTQAYQWNIHWGLKYAMDKIDGERYAGFTDLFLLEFRHDIGEKWDWGLHGGTYHSWAADVLDLNLGASLGYSPVTNVWVSLGYNFVGFRDDDFSGADYTAQGMFLKFRLKVDQFTLRDLWNDPK